MKISVNSTFSYITFYLNYGSALQCYALQKVLRERGHETSLLRDYRANPIFILKRLKNIRYPKAFMQKVKAQIALQSFIWKNIPLSKRAYFSYGALVKHCPDAHCHIAGSDQIWHNANNFRYLTYVPDDKLKLSYAASFGRSQIEQEQLEIIKPYLTRFDGIAVRESSAVEIINSMGLDAEWVLDPTLLLDCDQYPAEDIEKHDFCYGYFLNLEDRSDIPFEQIQEFCDETGREMLLTAPLNYSMFRKDNHLFPTVEEWLGYYKAADYIFTNTYHGMLFCIIFKKQFLLFRQKGSTDRENERFDSLLKHFNLTDRVYTGKGIREIREKMQDPIDYEEVYTMIRKARSETECFFEKFGI